VWLDPWALAAQERIAQEARALREALMAAAALAALGGAALQLVQLVSGQADAGPML
jgi:hypothetical protein